MQTALAISKVVPSDNYRRGMNKKSFRELVRSVKSKGILQPILVTPAKGKYRIVAGHRRHQAALEAGLKEIPVIVRENLTAEDSLELAVIENTQREDPNPMDEALGFQKLIGMGQHTPETLAARLDKSVQYVLGRLKLVDLPAAAQKKILSGEISIGHALLMTRLKSPEDLKRFLKAITEEGGLTVKAAKEELQSFGTSLSNAPFALDDCEECPGRTKNQSKLFPELKETDDCMDADCYFRKLMQHYEDEASHIEEAGFKVFRDEKTVSELTAYGAKNSRGISPEKRDWRHPKQYRSRCMRCKEHHAYYFFIVERFNGKRVDTGEICLNRKCFDEMNGVEDYSSGHSSATTTEHNHFVKAGEARDRFLVAELPPRVKKKKPLSVRLAIFQILDRFASHFGMPGREAVRGVVAEFATAESGSLYHLISSIPAERLSQALTESVLITIPFTEASVLLRATTEAGIDMARDFKPDEKFLNSKTKAELIPLAQSWGIEGLTDKMKKGEMLQEILKHDLTGKTTPDIVKRFAPTDCGFPIREEDGVMYCSGQESDE